MQVIGYVPTGLEAVAVVVHDGLPVTSEVASVSPLTNPESVAVNGGSGSPGRIVRLSGVTVSGALATASVPATYVNV